VANDLELSLNHIVVWDPGTKATVRSSIFSLYVSRCEDHFSSQCPFYSLRLCNAHKTFAVEMPIDKEQEPVMNAVAEMLSCLPFILRRYMLQKSVEIKGNRSERWKTMRQPRSLQKRLPNPGSKGRLLCLLKVLITIGQNNFNSDSRERCRYLSLAA
jgi:hypothetical protein